MELVYTSRRQIAILWYKMLYTSLKYTSRICKTNIYKLKTTLQLKTMFLQTRMLFQIQSIHKLLFTNILYSSILTLVDLRMTFVITAIVNHPPPPK